MHDLISRQAAIDAIRKGYPDVINSDYKDGLRIGTDRAIYHVEHMPSAQPEQRTGKWIKLDMHRGMADHKCTACEQECYVPTCMGEPLYAFCPNCGSYNGGEQDDKCRQV